MKLLLFVISLSLIAGLTTGKVFLSLLPQLPLANNHPLFQLFNLRRPLILGFLPYWLTEKGKDSYQPYLTDLAYFTLSVDADGSILKLVNPREQDPGWTAWQNTLTIARLRRAKDSGLQLALTLHSSNEDKILALLKDPSKHAKQLASETLTLSKEIGITHVNLDFESYSDVTEQNRQAFTEFIKEVAQGIKSQSEMIVSFDLISYHLIKTKLTDIATIAEYVDYVILMGYDFHFPQSYLTGPVSPISGAKVKWGYDVETAVELASRLVPRDKLVLGLTTQGYEWQTLSATAGAAVIPGSYAVASNRRVEELLHACRNCTAAFDDLAREPYIIFPEGSSYQQIFYANEASLAQKLELAKKYRLAGVAIWALGYEGQSMLAPLQAFKSQAIWSQ